MRQAVTSSGNGRELIRNFHFDLCASEEHSQSTFFRHSGVTSLLDSVAEGYLATVFAYGQTGSGKTYSMSGVEELLGNGATANTRKTGFDHVPRDDFDASDGLIRSLKYLFLLVDRAPKGVRFVVRVSYCEIYNEQVWTPSPSIFFSSYVTS